MGKLIQTPTSDGIILQGYYSEDSRDTALLHIHGFEGNFYENAFVQVLSRHLKEKEISFLTVNTRGCEKIKDFNTVNGKNITAGARYELLEEAYLDIDAWIKFLLDKGYKTIILQGHSLGTYKAVRYLYEGKYKDKISKLILLAPFDSKALVKNHTATPLEVLLQDAQAKIEKGQGMELITREYDTIDVSYKTFTSWYKRDMHGRTFEFCTPDYDFPALKGIKIQVKIIVGSLDPYFYATNPEHFEEAFEILKKNIPSCETVLINDADHGYHHHEDELAEEVIKFIK